MRRHDLIQQAQKLEPFLMSTMPFLTQTIDVGRVEGGEQSGRTVAFVALGHRLTASALRRQSRWSTIQSLNLAFLVHTQHQRVIWRVQIQAHDILQLFGDLRIVADLETLHPMRLPTVAVPAAMQVGLADAHRPGHRVCVLHWGGVGRLQPRRQAHHATHQTGRNLGRTTGQRSIAFHPRHPQDQESGTQRETFLGDFRRGRDLLVFLASASQQHDPGTGGVNDRTCFSEYMASH
jgi:hypothetical protein